MIALRDPTGLSRQVVMLAPAAYVLTRLMNGLRTRAEIVEVFEQRNGFRVDSETLDDLIERLEEGLVLDGPTARARLAAYPTRPMAHAGGAYPADPEQLRGFLDRLLAQEPVAHRTDRPLRGLMVPHIDLERGGASYAAAYQEFRLHQAAYDTVVVLGITHAASRTPFILTRKSFETPLGLVETDLEFVDELAAGLDFDPFTDEFNQFGEHSVEFQAVILKHLMGDAARIVPVLCGSFHECLGDELRSPLTLDGVASFLTRLGEVMQRRPRTLLLASVDLAHVGLRFGGERLTEAELQQLAERDRESLARSVEGDFEGFIASLQADRGERNYCGTSAIYAMLQVLGGPRGHLHRYQQCTENGNHSTVTVAAAGFYGQAAGPTVPLR